MSPVRAAEQSRARGEQLQQPQRPGAHISIPERAPSTARFGLTRTDGARSRLSPGRRSCARGPARPGPLSAARRASGSARAGPGATSAAASLPPGSPPAFPVPSTPSGGALFSSPAPFPHAGPGPGPAVPDGDGASGRKRKRERGACAARGGRREGGARGPRALGRAEPARPRPRLRPAPPRAPS